MTLTSAGNALRTDDLMPTARRRAMRISVVLAACVACAVAMPSTARAQFQPPQGEPFGLTCRVYHRRDGRVSPTPDPADVRAALEAAQAAAADRTPTT